jgi:hypothetical protein
MEGVSPANVNDTAPAMLAQGPRTPLRRAIGQDQASALALIGAVPPPSPQLATSGMMGTQLDEWA